MLRSFLISLLKAAWVQRLITNWEFAWRVASRFIAGNSFEEAIGIVRELNYFMRRLAERPANQ